MSELEVRGLCLKSREIFLQQPILLELEAPLKICGDIHGQYTDLLRLFEYGGFPPEANYLFLGDYVDRGKQSLETICLLLAYKIKYPENFFLLRGNHECASINRIYGFYDECKRRYNIKLWKTFTDCFNCLPIAAIIDEKIFCCHGGLSPDLQVIEHEFFELYYYFVIRLSSISGGDCDGMARVFNPLAAEGVYIRLPIIVECSLNIYTKVLGNNYKSLLQFIV